MPGPGGGVCGPRPRQPRTIVVTDGSKFTRTALAAVAPASSLDAVVTDETAPAAQLEALTAAGVTVRQV